MSLFHCDFLKDLIGSFVRVNRGGPESQKGTIISVCQDYFVLKNEKGELYYYQLKHLKSITKNVQVPIIANGGCGKIEHISEVVKKANASACAVGSMVVYQKKDMGVLVNFPDKKELKGSFNEK